MGEVRTIAVRNTRILLGDVRASLRTLPAGSVHCCVTSPPYWGLRAYGTEPQVWGGRDDCEHQWADASRKHPQDRGGEYGGGKQLTNAGTVNTEGGITCGACGACGAWRGELGSEPTIEQFVSNIVEVFREVKRVLRNDGTCWVNIGDSYAGSWGNQGRKESRGTQREINGEMIQSVHDGRYQSRGTNTGKTTDGLKPKDLCLIPWRVAIALQSDGWYVRDAIPWVKPAPMPESVTDRCTKAWEPIFMLAKSPKYFTDMEAVKEKLDRPEESERLTPAKFGGADKFSGAKDFSRLHSGNEYTGTADGCRNLRNVWTISNEPLSMPHFAAYPTALPARCIKIGTSERGVCPTCGDPWVRVTRKSRKATRPGNGSKVGRVSDDADSPYHDHKGMVVGNRDPQRHCTIKETTGWQPSCQCGGEPVPATVLDPFLGSGSTSVAAERLGRHSIGCELNESYAREIAVLRIQTALDDGEHKPVKPLAGQLALFASQAAGE